MATTTIYLVLPQSETSPPAKASELKSSSLDASPLPLTDIISQVKSLEKRNFPKNEAMDFDAELKKRNTELIVVLDTSPPEEAINFDISVMNRQPPKSLLSTQSDGDASVSAMASDNISTSHNTKILVVAYLLHARSAGASLLHKICVAEKYRRRGIARQLLSTLKNKLQGQGCERIQLWVDWQRDGAIELYKSVGFRRIDGARDYYGAGRHGVKLAIDLNWVW